MNGRAGKLLNFITMKIALCIFQFFVYGNLNAQIIQIENPSKLNRKNEVISIAWKQVKATVDEELLKEFKLINLKNQKELAYQLTYNGQKEIQELLIEVSVKAEKSLKISIQKGKPIVLEPKTFARFVPERLDDFAWENNKIAFRTYGKALEGTKGDAYGYDIWVKRTNKLVINTRYKHGDYHHDLGDGLDYYHVGHTLGAGNSAPIIGDSIWYSANYHRYKILDNGPLRTTFVLEYDTWRVKDQEVTASKKISIDAGSQLYKVEATYNFSKTPTLPIAIGIIRRPEAGTLLLDEKNHLMSYWEPQHGQDGTTGVGVIAQTEATKAHLLKDQILLVSSAKSKVPFQYYTGGVWDKAGEIISAKEWEKYLYNYREKLNKPLIIKFN